MSQPWLPGLVQFIIRVGVRDGGGGQIISTGVLTFFFEFE